MRQHRLIIYFTLIAVIGGGLGVFIGFDPIEEGRCRLRRKAGGKQREQTSSYVMGVSYLLES